MDENLSEWAPLPIRLAAGGAVAYHGSLKLTSRFGHDNIVSLIKQLGLPLPELSGWATGVLEVSIGLAYIGGVRVRTFGGLGVGVVVTNLLMALRRGGFPQPLPGGDPLPGVERSLLFGGCSLALMLSGPGRCALGGSGKDAQ
jgi:putative oxidoreductase